ncbi:MAG: DMT family transporter [Thermodesulfobacteriota bacterium]
MSLIVFLLIIASAFLHALWNFAAKKVSGNFQVIYLSLVMASALLLPFLFILPAAEVFNPRPLPYLLATGTIHAVYFFALGRAYAYGDISSSYPLARGTGVGGTALAAYWLLQEGMTSLGLLGVAAISIGTLLIGLTHSQPTGGLKGCFFALLVGTMIVAYSLIDKMGVGITHPVVYAFGLWFIAALWLTPYVLLKKRPELSRAWRDHKGSSLLIGAGSLSTYLLILFIFRIAPVGYVVALRETAVAIGALMGFVFLREKPATLKIAGIILIVIGMMAIKMA